MSLGAQRRNEVKNMGLFTEKTLMITGGTGSFGNAVLNRFLATDISEIRIFSRDEKKQDDMRHEFQAKMPEIADKIKFYIGDVRDIHSVRNAMHGGRLHIPRGSFKAGSFLRVLPDGSGVYQWLSVPIMY